jgi:hypothetical protein
MTDETLDSGIDEYLKVGLLCFIRSNFSPNLKNILTQSESKCKDQISLLFDEASVLSQPPTVI